MRLPKPLPAHLGDIFTTRDAHGIGVTPARLRNKDLTLLFEGVYVKVGSMPTVAQICAALQQGNPLRSRFSGITAAEIIGVPLPNSMLRAGWGERPGTTTSSRRIHISVPPPAHLPRGRNIAGHIVTANSGDTVLVNGLRISSPAQLWRELATHLDVLNLVAAGDFLIHRRRPFVTLAGLKGAMGEFAGQRGIRKAKEALELLHEGSESPQESKLRVILQWGGIATVPNVSITTSGGYRYRVDLAVVDRRVIIEYQSDKHHMDAAAYRRDMTRISRLEADNWSVIQVNANDLRDPIELCARVKRVCAR